MKKHFTLFLASAILLAGCSSPLDKPYSEKTFSEDMKSFIASGKLDQGQAMAMTFYVAGATLRHESLEGKSYKSLLEDMKNIQAQAAQNESQEKALAEKSAAADQAIIEEMQRAVSVAPYDREFIEKDYQHYVGIKYGMQNISGKPIKGFQGQLIFKDMFGTTVQTYLVSSEEPMAAGASTRSETYWETNQFDAQDKRFAATDFKKMKHEWRPLRILFADGKKLEAADAAKIQ